MNLLIVSLHYNNQISHLWNTTTNFEVITCCTLCLLVSFLLVLSKIISRYLQSKSWCKKASKRLIEISVIILALLLCSFAWNIYVSNCQNPCVIEPYHIKYSKSGHTNNPYTHKSLIHTNKIILHNHKRIPQEWKINQKLFIKSHIKNGALLTQTQYRTKQHYNHQYHNQLHKIYAQKHFDNLNKRYLNKYYIAKPAWYYYL